LILEIFRLVLRLFVTANEISLKSKNEDLASVYAISAIEKCKSADTINKMLESFEQEGAKITKKNDSTAIEYFYDEDWEKLEYKSNNSKPSYLLLLTLKNSTNKVYDMNSKVFQIDKKTDSKVLITEIITKKYF